MNIINDTYKAKLADNVRLEPQSLFVIVSQSKSDKRFYHLTEGRRLS